jgi:broad specificity phosphatase PhoE
MAVTIDLRRHAHRSRDADALDAEGRAQAEAVGRSIPTDYAAVFVSPAQRAAETATLFLRSSGQAKLQHVVVPGLSSEAEDRWRAAAKKASSSGIDGIASADPELVREESARLAEVVAGLFERLPEESRALAVGHGGLIEAAVLGLLGTSMEPLAECEGVRLVREGPDRYRWQELRL